MILTKEHLDLARSRRGAFSAKQLALFGLNFHRLKKGWERKLPGQDFPAEVIEQFIALKDEHLRTKTIQRFARQWSNETGSWRITFQSHLSEDDATVIWERMLETISPEAENEKAFKEKTAGL